MKDQINQFLKNITRRKGLLAIIILVLIGIIYFGYQSTKGADTTPHYTLTDLTKGTLVVSISGSGQVIASNQLDIKPQASGLITAVNVKQGDIVKSGQVLAIIDQRSAAASVLQSKSSVASAQASYNKLVAGTTSTDLKVSQTSVDSAKSSLDSAQKSGDMTIISAQNSLENAKRNYENVKNQQDIAVKNAHTDLLNSSLEALPSDQASTATVAISGTYAGTKEGSFQIRVYNGGNGQYYYSIDPNGAASTSAIITPGLSQPLGDGLYITFSTGTIYSTTWTIDLPNTKASDYLSNYNAYQEALQNQPQALATAQASVDSAQIALDQAKLQVQNSITSAQNSLITAQTNLEAKQVPALKEDVAASQAQLDSANAQLMITETNASNNIITAPFSGEIATVSIQKGDTASSGTAAFTLITKEKMAQISLNEVDIAKVKIGQKATLKIDALNSNTFAGQVTSIDVLGTVTQGVVNYNVKIVFLDNDDRIMPGMSVSAGIITDVKQDILMVPNAAVKSQNSISYIEILDVSNPVNIQTSADETVISKKLPAQEQVIVGATNDTSTEISGTNIKEGDQVIIKTTVGSKAATGSSSGSLGGLRIPGVSGGAGGNFGGGARGN
ncbi:MAG: HlyD family efflux transporter periplasmic adaptor subunit [Candidatus Gracilibacteria bacterium]|jgi:HlyD family secretion protein